MHHLIQQMGQSNQLDATLRGLLPSEKQQELTRASLREMAAKCEAMFGVLADGSQSARSSTSDASAASTAVEIIIGKTGLSERFDQFDPLRDAIRTEVALYFMERDKAKIAKFEASKPLAHTRQRYHRRM